MNGVHGPAAHRVLGYREGDANRQCECLRVGKRGVCRVIVQIEGAQTRPHSGEVEVLRAIGLRVFHDSERAGGGCRQIQADKRLRDVGGERCYRERHGDHIAIHCLDGGCGIAFHRHREVAIGVRRGRGSAGVVRTCRGRYSPRHRIAVGVLNTTGVSDGLQDLIRVPEAEVGYATFVVLIGCRAFQCCRAFLHPQPRAGIEEEQGDEVGKCLPRKRGDRDADSRCLTAGQIERAAVGIGEHHIDGAKAFDGHRISAALDEVIARHGAKIVGRIDGRYLRRHLADWRTATRSDQPARG